jgi:MFS family permease
MIHSNEAATASETEVELSPLLPIDSSQETTVDCAVAAQRKARRYERRFRRARCAFEKWQEARAWMRTPASKRSRFGLDWMNFFIADVETGFGTFVALYLAELGWSKGSVGLVLGVGQAAAVLALIPGGALVDAAAWKRGLAAMGICMILGAALIFAVAPLPPLVFTAEIMHGLAAGLVAPSIAAISLGLVGRKSMSSRTGRNYRFNAAGNAFTAIAMGLAGRYLSLKVIFFAAAGLCLPALFGLSQIRPSEIDYRRARNAAADERKQKLQSIFDVAKNYNLLIFSGCLVLFQFADASMLPLVAQNLGSDGNSSASLLTSGLIAAPQLVVMLLAPWVGYLSEEVGRKPLLLAGLVVETIRAMLLGFASNYAFLLAAQALGGIASTTIGVLTVLILTDLTAGTGRFNLTRGVVTMLSGVGASLSVAITGFVFQASGKLLTFGILAGIAAMAAGVALLLLRETKPAEYTD